MRCRGEAGGVVSIYDQFVKQRLLKSQSTSCLARIDQSMTDQ